MNHPLRNRLMVKVRHLLTEVEVFHQEWTSWTGLQMIIGVVHPDTLVGCHVLVLRILSKIFQLLILAVFVYIWFALHVFTFVFVLFHNSEWVKD